MQIQKITNGIYRPQNFKGNSAASDVVKQEKTFYPIPPEVSKAYASTQITSYKEIETFEIPNLGKGKMYELSNGHKIILVPKIGPTIINTFVKVGYMNEPENMRESSHILEHILANNLLKADDKKVEENLTKTGGFYNATTKDFFTNYFIQTPITKEEELDNLIYLQAKTLQHTDFTQEQLDKEKEIVSSELNYRGYEKSDFLLAKKLSLQNLFNLSEKDSEFLTERSSETFKNLKKEELMDYYNTFYKPENMVTTIVGNVDENSINIVAKYLGKIKVTKPEKEIISPKIPTDNLIQKTIRKDVKGLNEENINATIELSFLFENERNYKDTLQTRILRYAAQEKMKDFLQKSKNHLDFTFGTDLISTDKKDIKIFKFLGIGLDSDVEKNLKNIYTVLFDLSQNPLSEKELSLIKTKIKNSESLTKESSQKLSENYCELTQLNGSLKEEAFYLELLNKITSQDIQNQAKKCLDLNKASLVVVHPKNASNVKKPSFKGNMDIAKFEDIHEYALPNNLRVVIDSRPGISRTTVRMDLQAKKKSNYNLGVKILMDLSMNSNEFKKSLEEKGFLFETDGNSIANYKTINGDSEKTLEMLEIIKKAMFSPDFSQKDFNKMKNLLKVLDEPKSKRANYEALDEIFKEMPQYKEKEQYSNVTLQDIKNYHSEFLKNAQGTIVITIPPAKAQEFKQEIFKSLLQIPQLQNYDHSAVFNSFKTIPIERNKIFIETKKDDDSINIKKYYKISESGNLSDYAGMMILNEILGRSDKSRLFKNIRNENRLAYDVFSLYDKEHDYRKIAFIEMDSSITADKNNLRKVVEEYDNVVNNLIENPITEKELEMAKQNLKNSYLNSIESSYNRNEALAMTYNSFYAANYHQTLLEAIDKETPEHIQKLAQYYLTQPSLMAITGNEEAIEANKKYLSNLGEVIDCV